MPWILRSNRFKVFLLVVVILLILYTLSLLGSVFVLVILSILMTFLLAPVVSALETRGLQRIYGIMAVYLLIALLLFALLRTLLPPVLAQITSLENAVTAPNFAQKLQSMQTEMQNAIPFLKLGDILDKVNQIIIDLTGKWLSIVTSIGSLLLVMIIVPFVTFFFLKDGDLILGRLISLVPNRYFEMTLNVLHKIGVQLGRYIRAWLIEAAIVGALSVIGLSIMGVKYAVIIGVAAGLANLIPYLGPVVGAVPAILVSLIQSGNLSMLLPIVALFVAIRLADDLLIVPIVYSRGASMHPLTVVLLILIAAEVKGVLGMVLAIPLYTVLRVVAKETYWGLESYSVTKTKFQESSKLRKPSPI